MDVREAHAYLSQFEDDLAAESDPQLQAWYRTETELQPDYVLAKKTMAEFNSVLELIGQIARNKSQTEASLETPGEVLEDEQPEILTEEEKLRQRIDRKYATCTRHYQGELSSSKATKRSKRERQKLLARRQFARRFTDFSDVTGDAHIVLRPDLLELVASEVSDDQNLLEEIFANSAAYAERSAVEITSDPKRFAKIITASAEGRPHAQYFEDVLKGIFSTNPSNLASIYVNLAAASFEVLEDSRALELVAKIAHLEKSYVPPAFVSETGKSMEEFLLNGDIDSYISVMEAASVYRAIIFDVTGYGIRQGISPRLRQALIISKDLLERKRAFLQSDRADPDLKAFETIINAGLELRDTSGILYDAVEVSNFDGTETVDLGIKPISDGLRAKLGRSKIAQRRMEELSPYSYSIRAARKILGGGVHGYLIAISPSICFDVYIKDTGKPADEWMPNLRSIAGQLSSEVVDYIIEGNELGISSYQDTGKLRLVYDRLFIEGLGDAILMFRPTIALDRRVLPALNLVGLNYARIKDAEKRGVIPATDEEALVQTNDELRKAIKDEHERFLGRRPVKFPIEKDLQQTGLKSVSLRYDPKTNTIKATVALSDGEVELNLDRDFNIEEKDSGIERNNLLMAPKLYYENLILKLARYWMCKREVYTSEGTVSEETGNSANMGHFMHLAILPNGYKKRFRPKQAKLCREEKNENLAEESERRRLTDLQKTGLGRNSTYVREFYDPNKPPLVVHYSPSDLLTAN